MQKEELIIEPTLKAMIYHYRASFMSKKAKGSYQGNMIINIILSNFYIPAAFLFFYNTYYGIFLFLIGLFFVTLQNLYVRSSPSKIKYIVSKNEVKIIDGLNHKITSMTFDKKVKIKVFPSLKGDLHNFRSVILETNNNKFYLIGIPCKSVQKIADFIDNKKIENKEMVFNNNENSKFKIQNINTKAYLLITLFVNIVIIFFMFNILESTEIKLLQSMLLVLIISEIIFYFILKLFCKNN